MSEALAGDQEPAGWRPVRTFWGAFVRPAHVMDALALNPDIRTPALAIAMGTLAFAVVSTPHIIARVTEVGADIPARVSQVVGIVSVLLAVLLALGGWLMQSLALNLAGSFVSQRSDARAVLSVIGISMSPIVIRNLVRAVGVAVTGSVEIVPGMSGLLAQSSPGLLRAALSGIDLFGVWSAVLAVIGLAAVFRISKPKATAIMAVFWCASIAARWAVQAQFGA